MLLGATDAIRFSCGMHACAERLRALTTCRLVRLHGQVPVEAMPGRCSVSTTPSLIRIRLSRSRKTTPNIQRRVKQHRLCSGAAVLRNNNIAGCLVRSRAMPRPLRVRRCTRAADDSTSRRNTCGWAQLRGAQLRACAVSACQCTCKSPPRCTGKRDCGDLSAAGTQVRRVLQTGSDTSYFETSFSLHDISRCSAEPHRSQLEVASDPADCQ